MIKGKKIFLGPLKTEDLPVLFDWINDRNLVTFSAPFQPVHFLAHEEWFNNCSKKSQDVIFAIRLLNTEELIGTCKLVNIQSLHRLAELQIRIGVTSLQDQGYGTEAVKLLLDFAFRDQNLNRVFLHVFASNERARNLYKKVGFIEEGILRQGAYIDGNYLDVIVMGILEKEFKQSHVPETCCYSST